jgi:hypothetical protein
VRAQGTEDPATQRCREHEPALRVGEVGLRLVVHDLVPDQDEAAEDQPADHAADESLVDAAVLDPGEEAAQDGDRRAHHVVEDLVPAEGEAGEHAEHERHHDAAQHL